MKFYNQLLTLFALSIETNAFMAPSPKAPSTVALNSMVQGESQTDSFEMFPVELKATDRIEGGGTIRTYSIPDWATRIQYRFESTGRPLRGEANLWLGPLRKTHTIKFDTENGKELPIMGTLKFRKGPPQLKVSTSSDPNCPMQFGMYVPSPERAKELEANTEDKHYNGTPEQKQAIQGSGTDGKNGMWVYWHIPPEVESIQVVGWAIDTGKKSFKVDMEMLQGPNNPMQKYFLQCGGGSQPYHAVFQTPGQGWTLRVRNNKFVEDGKVELTVLPYKTKQGSRSDGGWDSPGGMVSPNRPMWN